jgi:hypothetical protein
VTSSQGARSAPVVAALEATWSAIQRRHPDLPDVVVVLASGSVGNPRGMLRLGHFAAMRWTQSQTHAGSTDAARTDTAGEQGAKALAGKAFPEVFVGGEGLALGPVDVLGTLLHEAAHALAHVRRIKDTSRQGRYHNRRFQALATEIGLDVREARSIGWSDTHVPDPTVTEYAAELDVLRAALTIHRHAEGALPTTSNDPDGEDPEGDPSTGGVTSGGRPSSNNGHACRCQCGRRIRVAPSVLALGPITCGLCGSPFTPTTPDTQTADTGTDGEDPDAAEDDSDETDAETDGEAS